MMTKPRKIMIAIFVSMGLMATALTIWFTRSASEVDVATISNDYVIDFEELDAKIFIRAKTWGVSGNHEEIVFSSAPFQEDNQCSKVECFIFYTSEIFYKKKGTDTLLVFAGASAISEKPNNFSSPIKIVVNELKNYDEVKDYEMNYKKYELSKVDVHK